MRILVSLMLLLGVSVTTQTSIGSIAYGYDREDYYYPGYRHSYASTIAEGAYRGMADRMRALGEFGVLSARTAILLEEARVANMENQTRWIDTYYDRQELSRQRREAKRGPRLSYEDLARIARLGRPDRLSPSELDGLTGEISWPVLLRDGDFARDRAKVEEVFAQRAASGTIETDDYLNVRQTVHEMRFGLKQRIQEVRRPEVEGLPAADYIQAKRFLRSLAYEAQQPTQFPAGVASVR